MTADYSQEMWDDDIKRCIVYCTCENRPTVFMANELHLKKSFMFEDINSLLNAGSIMNLFSIEDMHMMREKMSDQLTEAGKDHLLLEVNEAEFHSYFEQLVKKRLHIALAIKPHGKVLEDCIRLFPNLTSNCTINYFCPWPKEALRDVARLILTPDPKDKTKSNVLTEEQSNYISNVCYTIVK